MKKMLFVVLIGSFLFVACGGDKKTATEYRDASVKAYCEKVFECYPDQAAQQLGSEALCVAQGTASSVSCDKLNYDQADDCLNCYQTLSCANVGSGSDVCASTPGCLHACDD
jgi:hypothetical protein